VVDTLRHQETLVSRELSEESRDAELLERQRKIYRGQGIEVSDQILQQGVQAEGATLRPHAPAAQLQAHHCGRLGEKRRPCEADPLLMYLWKRKFGTSA
jgi:hypothetical protein